MITSRLVTTTMFLKGKLFSRYTLFMKGTENHMLALQGKLTVSEELNRTRHHRLMAHHQLLVAATLNVRFHSMVGGLQHFSSVRWDPQHPRPISAGQRDSVWQQRGSPCAPEAQIGLYVPVYYAPRCPCPVPYSRTDICQHLTGGSQCSKQEPGCSEPTV